MKYSGATKQFKLATSATISSTKCKFYLCYFCRLDEQEEQEKLKKIKSKLNDNLVYHKNVDE